MDEENSRVTSRYAKNYFGQVSGRVGFARERIIVTRNNRDFLAMVPLEDLELLEKLEQEQPEAQRNTRKKRRKITIDEIING